jgi:hypothetical protein
VRPIETLAQNATPARLFDGLSDRPDRSRALGAAMYVLAPSVVAETNPEIPAWARPVFAAVCVLQVACAVALWRWRKWGFYVFAAISIPVAVWNSTLTGSAPTLAMGPVAVLVMWLALRTGEADRRAWEQLH